MSRSFSNTPTRKTESNLGPLNDFLNNKKINNSSLKHLLDNNGINGINDLPKLSLEKYLSIYSSLSASEKPVFKEKYLKAFEDDGMLFQKSGSKSKKGGKKRRRRTRKNI